MPKLKVGIPKGSLERMTIDLFKRAGYQIGTGERSYLLSVDDKELECLLIRTQEIPIYVGKGMLDIPWIRPVRTRSGRVVLAHNHRATFNGHHNEIKSKVLIILNKQPGLSLKDISEAIGGHYKEIEVAVAVGYKQDAVAIRRPPAGPLSRPLRGDLGDV